MWILNESATTRRLAMCEACRVACIFWPAVLRLVFTVLIMHPQMHHQMFVNVLWCTRERSPLKCLIGWSNSPFTVWIISITGEPPGCSHPQIQGTIWRHAEKAFCGHGMHWRSWHPHTGWDHELADDKLYLRWPRWLCKRPSTYRG